MRLWDLTGGAAKLELALKTLQVRAADIGDAWSDSRGQCAYGRSIDFPTGPRVECGRLAECASSERPLRQTCQPREMLERHRVGGFTQLGPHPCSSLSVFGLEAQDAFACLVMGETLHFAQRRSQPALRFVVDHRQPRRLDQ